MAENILTRGEGLPGWGKTIIFVGGGLVVVFVGYKVYQKVAEVKKQQESKEEVKDVKGDLKELEKSGVKRTLTASTYTSEANKIFTAMDGWGTDNTAVASAIFKMKNDADILALIDAFGVRTISSGRGNPEPDFTGTLPSAITHEMKRELITEINKVLAKRGIKYRF